jgi:RHS repeat-associated protein
MQYLKPEKYTIMQKQILILILILAGIYFNIPVQAQIQNVGTNNFSPANVFEHYATYASRYDTLEMDYEALSEENASDKLHVYYNYYEKLPTSTCLDRNLKSAWLMVELSMGDQYEFGNEDELFKFSADMNLKYDTVKEKNITLSISPSTPMQLYRGNIEDIYADINYVKIEITDFTGSYQSGISDELKQKIQDAVSLRVYIVDDYGIAVSGREELLSISADTLKYDNPVTLSWSSNASCEIIPHYQIQLLRLYNTDEDYESTEEVYATVNWNDALTIETESPDTFINLTLAEGSGYYIWRIRAIGDYYDGSIANSKNWGVWTDAPENGDIVDITDLKDIYGDDYDYIFHYRQFDESKNWIFSRSFTEGEKSDYSSGQLKKAEALSYSDGLMRTRQSLRMLQELNDTLLISATVYDYVGRPALQSMTGPVEQTGLAYKSRLITSDEAQDTFYSPLYFDSDSASTYTYMGPEIDEGGKFVTDGSGNVNIVESNYMRFTHPLEAYGPVNDYFSDKNSDINVPSAGNYAYARTAYHQDGRVKKQTLFGDEHWLGMYDTTYIDGGYQRSYRTYYASVCDTELMGVLGNQTPFDTNMYKIVHVDPNSVATVEFKDRNHRTLATALFKGTDNHRLVEDVYEPKNIIRKEIRGNKSISPYAMVKEQSINLAMPDIELKLDYSLDIDQFQANTCIEYCSTCDYSLIWYIIQEETGYVVWFGTDTINPTDTTDPYICDNNNLYSFENKVNISDPGNYRIGRILMVNNFYADSTDTLRFSDYHANNVGAIMDSTELVKFDDLFALLDTNKLNDPVGLHSLYSTKLEKLYDYLDNLPTYQSSVIKNKNGMENQLQSDSASIWAVEKSDDSYTIASECCQIEIPKLSCDWNPCDDIWMSYNSSAKAKDETIAEMFKDDGGYYDFESMLLDKYEGDYGNDLYKYFNDRNGNSKYPTSFKYEIELRFDLLKTYYDEFWSNDVIAIKMIKDGDTIDLYYNQLENLNNTVSGDIDIKNYSDGSSLDFYDYNDDNEYYQFSGKNLFESIYQSIYDSLTPMGFTVTNYHLPWTDNDYMTWVDGLGYQYDIPFSINISIESSDPIDIEVTATMASNASSPYREKYFENFITVHEENENSIDLDFPTGNGAFNAMVNHMIFDEGDSAYDCFDLYVCWENLVNQWENLQNSDDAASGNGFDLLEAFLECSGKQYTGISNLPYGKITDSDGNPSINSAKELGDGNKYLCYGYGYLEYAYKAFPFQYYESYDIPYNLNIPKIYDNPSWYTKFMPEDEEAYKADNTAEDIKWTTFDATEWLNGDYPADNRKDSMQYKYWENFYVCVNTDFANDIDIIADNYEHNPAALAAGLNTFSNCGDNTPDTSCAKDFAGNMSSLVKSHNQSRKIWLPLNLMKQNTALSWLKAHGISQNIFNEIDASYYNLKVADTDGDGIPESIGSSEEIDNMKRAFTGKLEVKFEPDFNTSSEKTGYTKIAAAKMYKSGIISTFLNDKLANAQKAGIAVDEPLVSKWITEINGLTDLKVTMGTWANNTTANTAIENKEITFVRSAESSLKGSIKLRINNSKTDIIKIAYSNDGIIQTETAYFKFSELPQYGSKTFKARDCDERVVEYLYNKIKSELDTCRNNKVRQAINRYTQNCTRPKSITDTFKIEYKMDYHHFTLYYYDQAGNLVQVVPPGGVDQLEFTDENNDGEADVKPSREDVKNHGMLTLYGYNSLGQRTYHQTPDGGITQFWYNTKGQLRFSQNAKQDADGIYSYLKYDALGRIVESGESKLYVEDDEFISYASEETFPKNEETYPNNKNTFPNMSAYNNRQRLFTVYNTAAPKAVYKDADGNEYEQENLQNRISYTYNDDDNYTYYSYDAHGNVKWLIQQLPSMAAKQIAYEYNVYSGQVTKVKYNEGYSDQFFHRYAYDSDNRIRKVESSRDEILWENEARYDYYAHGPLKRLSVGHDNIQGLDYVYTINGWLKAINHQSLNHEYDPGKDGTSRGDVAFAPDVFGFTLGYFDGDFKRSHDGEFSAFNSVFQNSSDPYYATGINQLDWELADKDADQEDVYNRLSYYQLFDGSITHETYNTAQSAGGQMQYDGIVKGFKYKYDELYRLVESNFNYFSENSFVSSDNYYSAYSYDVMGNITGLSRNAYEDADNSPKRSMDNLTYSYNSNSNQLNYIQDDVADASWKTDLDKQDTDNYTYDEIGQLLSDEAEGISKIVWTSTNRIDSVYKTIGDTLSFQYDAMGMRTLKKLDRADGTAIQTYYVRDAKGNTMAVYEDDDSAQSIAELPLYEASGRIGLLKPEDVSIDDLADNTEYSNSKGIYSRNIGNKNYELKDHLGNVRVVVSDEKVFNDDSSYAANILSQNDYYPFGMQMPGRSMSVAEAYRYGFQGKEKDDDLKGSGNSYDFGARMLDPRVGRWLSMDPLVEKFPSMSPYNAMGNNPVNLVDPDGRMTYGYAEGSMTYYGTPNDNSRGIYGVAIGMQVGFQGLILGSGAKVSAGPELQFTQDAASINVCVSTERSYGMGIEEGISLDVSESVLTIDRKSDKVQTGLEVGGAVSASGAAGLGGNGTFAVTVDGPVTEYQLSAGLSGGGGASVSGGVLEEICVPVISTDGSGILQPESQSLAEIAKRSEVDARNHPYLVAPYQKGNQKLSALASEFGGERSFPNAWSTEYYHSTGMPGTVSGPDGREAMPMKDGELVPSLRY